MVNVVIKTLKKDWGEKLKSINDTKKLWNKDKKFKAANFNTSPMCCWFWCIIFGWG